MDVSHKEGNVSLYIYGELLHLGDKFGFGSDRYGAVTFQVKEVLTCEGMVFITNYLLVTETAQAVG